MTTDHARSPSGPILGHPAGLFPELSARLRAKGWLGRQFGYGQFLERLEVDSQPSPPAVSVIVEITRPDPCAVVGLHLLRDQAGCPFQLIMVDNACDSSLAPRLLSLGDARVRLRSPVNTHLARNLGSACAEAPVLVFLSDAVRPQPDILTHYLRCFKEHRPLGARGAISGTEEVPATLFGRFSRVNMPHTWAVDLDENMAVDADAFFALGGFDETQPQGYGALDISIRLYGLCPDVQRQRHLPSAKAVAGAAFDASWRYTLRQRAWHELNEKYSRALLGYCVFWVETMIQPEQAHALLV